MRYLGSENEYNPFLYHEYNMAISEISPYVSTVFPHTLYDSEKPYICLDPIIHSTAVYPFNYFGVWLKNGGRIYTDYDNTEYASPECLTIKESVLTEKAGELIMPAFFTGYDNENLYLLKRTTSAAIEKNKTAGSHESYAISPDLFTKLISVHKEDQLFEEQIILTSHLATRIIYTGAGHLEKKINPFRANVPLELSFCLSPRAHFIETNLEQKTKEKRPLINQRKKPLVDQTLCPTARLHLICGDLNRSDWSIYLKHGATFLLLVYLEIASAEDIQKLVSVIMTGEPPVTTIKKLSHYEEEYCILAINTQIIILNHIEKYKNALIDKIEETETIINRWHEILEDFSLDTMRYKKFAYKLDWSIKCNLFENRLGGKIKDIVKIEDQKIIENLLQLDLSYHRVNNNYLDLYCRLKDKGYAETLYTEQEIAHYIKNPPSGRAALRVKTVEDLKKTSGEMINLNWQNLTIFQQTIAFDNIDFEKIKKQF